MHFERKLKIHKTMVRPEMTYGEEICAHTSRKQLLRTVEINTLRNIYYKTKLNRARKSLGKNTV